MGAAKVARVSGVGGDRSDITIIIMAAVLHLPVHSSLYSLCLCVCGRRRGAVLTTSYVLRLIRTCLTSNGDRIAAFPCI